ncbi:unnamed protein product [Chrysoparadoxa australica]
MEGDTEVVRCPIKRAGCVYDENDQVVGECGYSGTFLSGYTLVIEVLPTVDSLRSSRKTVVGCQVDVEESDTIPTVLREKIVMQLTFDQGRGIHVGWILLFCFLSLAALAAVVRSLREQHCIVCGNRLICFCSVCSLCRFYGYELPSKGALDLMATKRKEAVNVDLTLTERAAGVSATAEKMLGETTARLKHSKLLQKVVPQMVDTARVDPNYSTAYTGT